MSSDGFRRERNIVSTRISTFLFSYLTWKETKLVLLSLAIVTLKSAVPESTKKRVYYSLAVWRFKPILSAGLRFHSYLSGGLRLRYYRAVAGNQKFCSRFSVFACSCGGYSNRVKRLRRLSGNFVLLKASLFNEGLLFRARPSQSELPSVSPAMWAGVRS